MARRLLTTRHVSQSIDPFVPVGGVRHARPWRNPCAHGRARAVAVGGAQRGRIAALRRELDPPSTGVALAAAELDSAPAAGAPARRQLEASATLPRGMQSRVLVRVACKGNANWNLNVPVEIHRKIDVLVIAPRGGRAASRIGAGDVTVQSPGAAGPGIPVCRRRSPISRAGSPAARSREGTAVTADALAGRTPYT